MEFEKLIEERYSVREFKSEKISKEHIDKILEAGHKAPTGRNIQPQRILVINTDEAMEKLRNCTRCHFGAPNAVLVCYNEDEARKRPYDGAITAPTDAAIVATHMMLEAHNIGVGCCWVQHFNPFSAIEEFNIPENFKPLALLVMGYPADDAKPLGLHFQFRPINEVVFYNKF